MAADYGVPHTRTRAILMASRVRTVTPPEPTHAEHPEGVDLFGAVTAWKQHQSARPDADCAKEAGWER